MARNNARTQNIRLPINDIRQESVSTAFRRNIGVRAILLTPAFPFLVIGKIVNVISDYVLIRVETTSVSELEGRVIRIHLDQVEVFFIEEPGSPRIPSIRNVQNPGKRGSAH